MTGIFIISGKFPAIISLNIVFPLFSLLILRLQLNTLRTSQSILQVTAFLLFFIFVHLFAMLCIDS